MPLDRKPEYFKGSQLKVGVIGCGYVGLPLGQSYYDSMVLQLRKRFGAGLAMNLNYTLSRQEGNSFNNFVESYDVAGIQDFANLGEAAHTLSPYDTKHAFKGAVSYELPLGHGRRLFSGAGTVTGAAAGGVSSTAS